MPAQVVAAHVTSAGTTSIIAAPATGLRIVVHGMHLSAAAAAGTTTNAQIQFHSASTSIFSTDGTNDAPMSNGLILAEGPAATGLDVVATGGVSYTVFYSVRPV